MSPFTVAVPAATSIPRTKSLGAVFGDCDALVVGPGLGAGEETRGQVRLVLRRSGVPVLLDADALNVLAPIQKPLACGAPLILTPHPGEAARLLSSETSAVQADRVAAVQRLADRSGQLVVLKGHRTLVCDGQRLFENKSGNPGMATGGSGDVLAGLMGALLAQGMEPFDAACLAVDLHGRAGDLVASRLSQAGLCAEDLPLAIAEVMG
jgi:NAD(P)H-hydrate epimerase